MVVNPTLVGHFSAIKMAGGAPPCKIYNNVINEVYYTWHKQCFCKDVHFKMFMSGYVMATSYDLI